MTKRLTLLALLFATSAQAGAQYDYGALSRLSSPSPFAPMPAPVPTSASCGIPPLPPLGCTNRNAACVCLTSGQCGWLFLGCQ